VSELALCKGKLADAMPLILAHHYTRRRTADPMHVFLWKDGGATVAAAVFTSPVNRYFGKGAIELSRLVRVPELTTPLTGFLSLCFRWLKKNTDIKFCLSYADTTAGHFGYVYQAASMVHVAISKGNTQYRCLSTGAIVSGRSFDQHAAHNKVGYERLRSGKKYLYVKPLRERKATLLSRFGWSELPYPKSETFDRSGMDYQTVRLTAQALTLI
jgi:hypothetical protein